MALLRDEDLVARVQAVPPLVQGLRPPADWYSRDSPVQPTSIDLTIGNIFVPGADPDVPGGVDRPRTELSLETGQTAIVTTQEELRLPGNIAGIGFPPSSRVSFRGLLMTNPGHIDPGYVGVMRFTVINMARESYQLRRGAPIVTVLFFELIKGVRSDFVARRPNYTPSGPTLEEIDRLSKDFVNVEERSTRIAKSEAKEAGWKVAALGAIVPLIVAALTIRQNVWRPAWAEELQRKMAVLEKAVQFEKETNAIRAHQTQLDAMAKELAQVKAATCNQRPSPAYCGPNARP